MKHKTLDEMRNVAAIRPSWLRSRPLTRRERLERWAEVLERAGDRRLKTLYQIEYLSREEWATLRANDSPLSVAFGDPQLRAEGLAGDSIGDAVAFFDVSEMELHRMLCFCHHGETILAHAVATRVRATAVRAVSTRPLQLSPIVIGGGIATMIALVALIV